LYCNIISKKIFLLRKHWTSKAGIKVILRTEDVKGNTKSLQLYSRKLAASIKKPYDVRYNPYTQSLEDITTPNGVSDMADVVREDMYALVNALKKSEVMCKSELYYILNIYLRVHYPSTTVPHFLIIYITLNCGF
jgi:hypothetical protein